jgi:uncharacterized membrane protein
MAAIMEISLRMAFCALTGSRYAALVAASQETHWLIENCDTIARQHHELTQQQRTAVRQALRACRQANHDRNRLVHEAWATHNSGDAVSIPGLRRSYEITGSVWSAAEIRAVADAVVRAQHELLASVESALGPESLALAKPYNAQGIQAGPSLG